jgi:hypothetical protein
LPLGVQWAARFIEANFFGSLDLNNLVFVNDDLNHSKTQGGNLVGDDSEPRFRAAGRGKIRIHLSETVTQYYTMSIEIII